MKVAVVFLAALCAVAMSQNLHGLISHEVHTLYQADKDLTPDMCTTKCDALFDLINGHDETMTDKICKEECECQKAQNCHHHGHHPTHPARH